MPTRRKVLVGLQLIVALLLVLGATPAFGDSPVPGNVVPGRVESTTTRLANGLEQQGFEVARGYFKLYTNDDCPLSWDALHTCMGNNPAAPYVLPLVPAWPDEWVDSALSGAVGTTVEGYEGTFRLAEREAIVIAGVLPPPARYFGLQTYVFTREGTYNMDSPQYGIVQRNVPYLLPLFFTTVPNNAARIELFATVSNSNNNVVIERQSGAAWNQVRYFVITPDKSMDAAVRSALGSAGVAARDIFTEPIPGNLKLGLDASADDFLMLMRYAMPVDGGASGRPSDRWRHELPLVVMRVRDARTGTQPLPYPAASLDPKTAVDERGLQVDLDILAENVKAKWGQSEANVSKFVDLQSQLFLVGPICANPKVGENCLGDTQDNAVRMSQGRLHLDPLTEDQPEQVYAVVGALGTETGSATYVGLGLNDSLKQLGIGNVSDDQLKNSARGYGLGMPVAKTFFVYYFTRDCTGLEELTGGYCFSIPTELLPPCRGADDLTCQLLVFSLRNYIVPGTQRGPDSAKLLGPEVIWLHRPQ
jgi:hypothetical protein